MTHHPTTVIPGCLLPDYVANRRSKRAFRTWPLIAHTCWMRCDAREGSRLHQLLHIWATVLLHILDSALNGFEFCFSYATASVKSGNMCSTTFWFQMGCGSIWRNKRRNFVLATPQPPSSLATCAPRHFGFRWVVEAFGAIPDGTMLAMFYNYSSPCCFSLC